MAQQIPEEIPEAVAKALQVFEDGARYGTGDRTGTFDPDLVCDVLELAAEKAMAEGGNALFWMATLIQAGRFNEALLVLAQEAVRNGSSGKKIQAIILLTQELFEEEPSEETSGPRKFRPKRPHRDNRPQGGNDNGFGRGERGTPPRVSGHMQEPPRWSSTMNGGQPQQGPTPPHVGHRQPPSAPPLPQTSPQGGGSRPEVPDYGQQYGQPTYGPPQQGSTQEAPPVPPRRPEPAPVWEQEPEPTPLPEDDSGEHRPTEKGLAADLNAKPKDDVTYRD